MAKKRDAAKQSPKPRRPQRTAPVEVEAARPLAPKPAPIVVGIGASAGGLEPLQQFMDHMPPQSGVAFVVVQHPSPDFKSVMQELFSRHTSMTVRRAEDGMPLEPDCVYVIPPNKNLLIADGRLQLVDQDLSPGHRPSYPIDIFFESLAEQLGNECIGVVLSGTGTDGTRGIRAIHEAGGLVMAQDPQTAQFDGMPRSVIATGLADYILPPDEMARAVHAHVTHSRRTAGGQMGARVLEEEGRPAEPAIAPLKLDGDQESSAFARDLTDRRRAEETRTRLAAIVESSEDTIIGKRLDGTITSWNAAAERMYGYTAAETVGRNIRMLTPPERRGEVARILERLKRGEHIKRLETTRVTKDGRVIDVSVTFSPIKDAEGHPIGAATIARDITDVKQADRRRREVTLALTNAMPGISRVDLEGRYEYVNDDYAAMLHARPGSLRGQAWERTVHRDDRAAARAAHERSMKEGKAEFEATAVRADGSHFFAQMLMVRRDEGGRPAGQYCFMRDITDRKQAQVHLQLLQRLTEAISESPDLASAMSVALARIRETTGWAFAEAWAADSGGDSLEYLGASFDPEPAFESFAASSTTMTVKRGQGLPGRVWSAMEPELIASIGDAPSGAFLRVEAAAQAGFTAAFAVPIMADGEVMAILVFFMRDPRKPHLELVLDLVATVAAQLGSVVRRKRVDEALQWANAELAHRNEHMNEFLYSISHDLKAPLVSIGGIAALLQEAVRDGDTEGAEDLLETLERTTGTMRSTIDDLLELARSGSVSDTPEPVELAELVGEALARLDHVLRAKGFEVEVVGDLPCVCVDRDAFARVLDNILVNATKYAADVPAPRIELGADASAEEHRLFIADNGPGIEAQHYDRIFKPFQRLDPSQEGTGIGLAIVRRIMAAHGGQVWVESEAGRGATFWLALPARPVTTVSIA